jgi:predicted porin
MKKITLAAIMALATLGASAQVTLSGKISQWADSTTTGSTRVGGMTTEPTSNIAFSVTEDLGA